jgi:type IV secretion system protein VirB6
MTLVCAAPATDAGLAVWLDQYLDCQARALGENGFQALAGGPMLTGLLSGLITIFVALIGYRLILGIIPDLRDGIVWAIRLGVVLALTTSWPAFQTLIYRVAVDAPVELAGVVIPAVGLPSAGLHTRIQQAYDTMRIGATSVGLPATDAAPLQSVPRLGPGQPALPQTASLLVVSTTGVVAALRLAVGFLLAVAPLALLGLLFDATLGLFSGWVRALAGAALGVLAATLVTAIELVALENQLSSLQAYQLGGVAGSMDPQALTTIVLLFALVMVVVVAAAARMGSAFRLPALAVARAGEANSRHAAPVQPARITAEMTAGARALQAVPVMHARVNAVGDALAATVRREQAKASDAGGNDPSGRTRIIDSRGGYQVGIPGRPLGVSGRRSSGRRTRSGMRRDRSA